MGIFEGHNHVAAFATAWGTLGGFQTAPAWFTYMSQNFFFNIFCSTILIYQGGGNLDFTYSLIMATLFYILLKVSSYIKLGSSDEGKKRNMVASGADHDSASQEAPVLPAEATAEEAESFLGYYFD